MGHMILLYSIVALFGGIAITISGECFFNNKIIVYFGVVITLLSTIAIGLFSSYAMESLAIASIRIFAISGIIYSLSDLWRLRGSTSV